MYDKQYPTDIQFFTMFLPTYLLIVGWLRNSEIANGRSRWWLSSILAPDVWLCLDV